MKNFILLATILFSTYSYAQRPQPDVIQTNNGDIKIQPILHGTLVIEWNDEVIYFDPYGGGVAFEGIKEPTMIFITDIHGDHLNTNTLDEISTANAKFIVPQTVLDQLPTKYRTGAIVMKNGDTRSIDGIPTVAVPMYNLPEDSNSRHTKGRGNGYILNLGGKNIYISGDTEDISEMRALKNIEVAFVCMNLPYTMDINQAADAVLDFKPKIVYPFHYRGQGGLADVEGFKKMVSDKNANIEVRLRNWYPEY